MNIWKYAEYLRNCFWMLVPILLFNWAFARSLPPTFQMNVFWNRIPWTIAVPENVFRTAVMILPLFMRFRMSEPSQKLGFMLYLIGLLAYFASWAVLIILPQSLWSTTAFGFLAPAYTPILWLGGIAIIGDQLQFPKVPLQPWVYGSLSQFVFWSFTICTPLLSIRAITNGGWI